MINFYFISLHIKFKNTSSEIQLACFVYCVGVYEMKMKEFLILQSAKTFDVLAHW